VGKPPRIGRCSGQLGRSAMASFSNSFLRASVSTRKGGQFLRSNEYRELLSHMLTLDFRFAETPAVLRIVSFRWSRWTMKKRVTSRDFLMNSWASHQWPQAVLARELVFTPFPVRPFRPVSMGFVANRGTFGGRLAVLLLPPAPSHQHRQKSNEFEAIRGTISTWDRRILRGSVHTYSPWISSNKWVMGWQESSWKLFGADTLAAA
jgi:hypothetical protein